MKIHTKKALEYPQRRVIRGTHYGNPQETHGHPQDICGYPQYNVWISSIEIHQDIRLISIAQA